MFSDPEGLELELVIDDDEDEPLLAGATDLDEQVAIRGMHAVRAYSADPTRSAPVLGEVLGMEPKGAGRWLASGERRHGLVVYDTAPAERGITGAGTVHHVAFTIRNGEQDAWRFHLAAAGLRPTPVLDRKMTKSVYFREPSRVLLEVATDQPGFVFEPPEHLGESLGADRRSRAPPRRARAPLPPTAQPVDKKADG